MHNININMIENNSISYKNNIKVLMDVNADESY
jgi:hypothetical protein